MSIARDLGLTDSEWDMAKAMCRRSAGNGNEAEDLMQEVAVELHVKAAKYAGLPRDERKALIRRIVRDKLAGSDRGNEKRRRADVPMEETIEAGPPEMGDVFVPWRPWISWRHYWVLQETANGLTTKEIATKSGLSPRTIRRLLVGARKVLATYFPSPE